MDKRKRGEAHAAWVRRPGGQVERSECVLEAGRSGRADRIRWLRWARWARWSDGEGIDTRSVTRSVEVARCM